MISKKAVYCLLAIFPASLVIFFKKKALLVGIPPFDLLLQVMIIAAIILNINLFLFQKKYITKIKKIMQSEWKMIFWTGFLLFAAYFTSTFGLRFTTSINYSFIIRSSLIFSTILSFFFLEERMYREKLLLIISFFVGIYLVSTAGEVVIPQSGDLLVLMGAFFFASFSMIQKFLSKYLPPELISWGVISSSALYSIVVSILFKINILSTHSFLVVFLAGIFEALVVLFMNKAIRITSVTYYYMMTMLVPIINGFLGIIFLSESLRFIQIFGGIILIVSVFLAQKLKF